MKSVITILLVTAVLGFGNTQVAELLDDAKSSATYLSSGFQNDCYALKYGDVKLEGGSSEMTSEEVKAMLESGYEIVAGEGCEKAGKVEFMEMKFDYASGVSNTVSFEAIGELAELSLRLIQGLEKITIQNVRFADAAGSIVSLEDHVITVK